MTCNPPAPGCGDGARFPGKFARRAVFALFLAGFPAIAAGADTETSPDPVAAEFTQGSLTGPSADAISPLFNTARIGQTGDLNNLTLYQFGTGNAAAALQDGDANAVWLGQQVLPGLTGTIGAEIIQSGGQNAVIAWQRLDDGGSGVLGPKLRLHIYQDGDGNYAESMQDGWNNDGLIAQSGDGNWASLQQTGSLHSSTIVQAGNNLSATSIQIGAGSTPISIYQSGDGAPSVVVTNQ